MTTDFLTPPPEGAIMSDPRMTGTKTCSKCKRDLAVIYFSVDKKRPDGLYGQCRDCRRSNPKSEKKRNSKKPSYYLNDRLNQILGDSEQ